MRWHRNELSLALAFAAVAVGVGVGTTAATAAGQAPARGRVAMGNPLPAAKAATVTVTSHFLWRPVSGSLSGDSTFLDNGATNGKQKDLLFVTPNLSPGGISPCPCLLEPIAPVGVWYNGSQWAIFNEDDSTMGTLASYNVLVVPKAGHQAFAVHATSASKHGDYVIINSPVTNNNPKALLQVTQVFNPSDVANPHQIGVRYFKVRRRWAIFNEDGAAMPLNASFNVLVGNAPSNGGQTALLTATAGNKLNAAVLISNAETTGNPNNVVFVTQDFNPGDKGGKSDKASVIVAYSGTNEATINWGSPGPAAGTAFNLLIFSS
jgi:hypothetical protein